MVLKRDQVVTLKEGDMYGLYYWEGDFYCIVIEDSIDVAFLDIDEETREEIAKEILAGNFKIDEHV